MFMLLGVLGFLSLIIFLIMAIISLFKKNGKAKRNFIIAGISFILFMVGAINDDSPEVTDEDKQEQEEKEDAKIAKGEKKKEDTKKNNEDQPFDPAAVEAVNEMYLEIADEYDGLIIKIEPKSDDYTEINVMVEESVYNSFEDNEKQMLIDEIGNSVENFTRAKLYGTPSSEFLYVYFVNNKFEEVAKTGHFDRGWKVK